MIPIQGEHFLRYSDKIKRQFDLNELFPSKLVEVYVGMHVYILCTTLSKVIGL